MKRQHLSFPRSLKSFLSNVQIQVGVGTIDEKAEIEMVLLLLGLESATIPFPNQQVLELAAKLIEFQSQSILSPIQE